jgi:hypothetical protein
MFPESALLVNRQRYNLTCIRNSVNPYTRRLTFTRVKWRTKGVVVVDWSSQQQGEMQKWLSIEKTLVKRHPAVKSNQHIQAILTNASHGFALYICYTGVEKCSQLLQLWPEDRDFGPWDCWGMKTHICLLPYDGTLYGGLGDVPEQCVHTRLSMKKRFSPDKAFFLPGTTDLWYRNSCEEGNSSQGQDGNADYTKRW